MASINEALANHKLYRLLKRIAEGDEQAVDNLYSDYGDFIYFHILNITDNKYIAKNNSVCVCRAVLGLTN